MIKDIETLTRGDPIITLSPFNHAKYKRSFPKNHNKRYNGYRKIIKINEMKTIRLPPKYIL